MAVPKGKVSSARQNKRRSNVWKLQAPALMKCPQCGEYKTPHRVCGNCGYALPSLFSKKPYVDANGMALKMRKKEDERQWR